MKDKGFMRFTARDFIGISNSISFERKELTSDYKLHWHDFFEIEVITDGKGTQILNGREYPIKRGCVYLLSPVDFHEVKVETPLSICNIMFKEGMMTDEFLTAISADRENNIFYFGEDEFKEITDICDLLDAEYSGEKAYRSGFLRNQLECLLMVLLSRTKLAEKTGFKTKGNHIQKGILYMQCHFKESPSLAKTAEILNLNPNYLSLKFKETTGVTYTEYLTNLKISYAKKLLCASGLTVTEICFASGFSSLSNFIRVFKEKTGFSPSQYAKKHL